MKNKKRLQRIVAICGCLFFSCYFTMGCGSKDSKGIAIKKMQVTEEAKATEVVGKLDVSALENGVDRQSGTDKLQTEEKGADGKQPVSEEETQEVVTTEMVVYVCGAVNNPGVYTLSGTPRMADAVEAAGGMNEQADKNILNLAQYISDGQMIRIPAIGEVTDIEDRTEQQSSDSNEDKANNSDVGQTNSKIDLNSATVTELMTIPGVGQTKAEAIVRYREENGRFEKVEDIMQISGIKEGSFAKMEPYICVN